MISDESRSKITLCAVEPKQPVLGLVAMRKSIQKCGAFERNIFVTDRDAVGIAPAHAADEVTTVFDEVIGTGSAVEYGLNYLKAMQREINTPFALMVYWDGWIVDSDIWTDEFLEYDVIGAPWPWHQDGMQVGCGPQWLSRKLLDAIAKMGELPPDGNPLDNWIGRTARPRLEKEFGIKYAPPQLAARFAYERHTPWLPTFSFHGVFNLWRHADDTELAVDILPLIAPYVFRKFEMIELLGNCIAVGRWRSAEAITNRLREEFGGIDAVFGHAFRHAEARKMQSAQMIMRYLEEAA